MAISSGTVRLFSGVIFAIATASSLAYGLRHKNELAAAAKFARQAAESNSVEPAAEPGEQASDNDNDNVNAAPEGVTLSANQQGHFETEVEINGRSVEVLVDTGATLVAMTYEDAENAGIFLKDSDFTHRASTANGVAKIAPVQISKITIGDITVRNIRAAVSEPGKLQKTLLGMSFLGRLSRVNMHDRTLELKE